MWFIRADRLSRAAEEASAREAELHEHTQSVLHEKKVMGERLEDMMQELKNAHEDLRHLQVAQPPVQCIKMHERLSWHLL
jgi:hypothetical protein